MMILRKSDYYYYIYIFGFGMSFGWLDRARGLPRGIYIFIKHGFFFLFFPFLFFFFPFPRHPSFSIIEGRNLVN